MSSLADILTATKNLITSVNNLTQTYLEVQGTKITAGITGTTLVSSSAGRVASISVTNAGTGNGSIYDSTSTSSPTNLIYTIYSTAGTGIKVINLPVNLGIVVAPGAGQTITISYS